jgi:hypothetical protein
MKLHDLAFSPNSRKVRAVAYELGVPLDYAHVDLVKGESRTPAFLELNPRVAKTLAGLMSRWTIPLPWAALSTSRSWSATEA